ncbi:MAG: DEAD/DEAH box helicase [Deltaproteobacteria bacterium]|nr:DEAD/DEAH box helicase [Deltaproteobacteria bacterium]
MSFDQLGLRDELLKAVKDKDYTAPTLIQAKVIPAILDGRDILARAQTGTGKTDAFALPLVEILSRNRQKGNERYPRALVLTPTRELALQVGESIKAYARRVSLRCTVVYGGVSIDPQIDRLRRGIDILVATPGRLLDLAGQRHLNLSLIEFLVFDEADRMLDLGFSEEISEILNLLPSERRTMLFSATYTQQIRDLARKMLKNPEYIEVTPDNTAAESVTQKVHLVHRSNKLALLIHLITRGNWNQILIFTRTRYGANKLTENLGEQGISVAAMHGNKSQSVRIRTLESFKKGEVRVLVATDVAARGLDISNLPYVVNYDMPGIPEDYVHRIGRTGRAGEKGIAISLITQDDKVNLKAIEKLLKQKIPVEKVEGYTEDSDTANFLIFRPNGASKDKEVEKAIKERVARKKASAQRLQTRNVKTTGSGKKSSPESKTRSGRKNNRAGKKPSKSGSHSQQSSKQGKLSLPRAKRK